MTQYHLLKDHPFLTVLKFHLYDKSDVNEPAHS